MLYIYLLIGILSGILTGLLGIGGGIVVIPALVKAYLYSGMPAKYLMHLVVGTSLSAMVITSPVTVFFYHKHHSVHWPIFFNLLPGLILGSALGAITAHFLPSWVLQFISGCLLLLIALQIIFIKAISKKQNSSMQKKNSLIGVLIGILSGFLGVASGAFLIPFMLRWNLKLQAAMGTATACGMVIAIVGATGFMLTGLFADIHLKWNIGYAYLPACLSIALSSIVFVPLGTALAHKLPIKLLRYLFAIFLIIMAADLIWSS